jgi:hypothetical protein
MGQQHSQFLTAERLYMHRTVQSHPDHLSDAACVVAVGLVDLRLQHRLHVARLDTELPASARALKSHCDSGPASSPIRLKR